MDLEQSTLIFENFTGGMNDYFLQGTPEEYELAQNLLLTPDAHLYTRPGSKIYSDTIQQLPVGQKRIGNIFTYEDELFVQSERNIYRINGAWEAIANPNPALTIGLDTNYIAHSFWNNHILVTSDAFSKPVKIFKDGSSYKVRPMGLPKITGVTGSGTAGANTYLYALHYYVEYSVQGVLFADEGPVFTLEVASVNAPDVNTITLSNIPVISNGAIDNYDTANIKVKIFRTENNGTTYFYVGEITNGTTSYGDTTADSIIVDNLIVYTTGGVLSNDPPPLAAIVGVVNNKAYFCDIYEGSERLKNRIRESLLDNPDAEPEGNFVDVKDPIVGFTGYNGNPIVFSKTRIYRLEGTYDELGGGGINYVEFSETIGAVNHESIVQTKDGIFFCGNDGFYFTDGYTVKKISEKMNKTYAELVSTDTQKRAIIGRYDRTNNRVMWACRRGTTSISENDIIFCLDLRFGVRPNSSFTTWVGETSFNPSAICFFNGDLIRGDSRGYLFKHLDTLYTDPKVNVTISPSSWTTETIYYDFKSAAVNFGLSQIRKWVPKILLSTRNEGHVSIEIGGQNDDSKIWKYLKEIRDYSACVWGDPVPTWGDATSVWNAAPVSEEERRFPSTSLRTNYKQVRIRNAWTNIVNSDARGLATNNTTAKTVTISGASAYFYEDLVDYKVSFADDGYIEEWLITEKLSSTSFKISDPNNTMPSGASKKWIIRGYAKGDTLHLVGFTLYFSPLSKTYGIYRKTEAGNNV